jgi:hypothetical protein
MSCFQVAVAKIIFVYTKIFPVFVVNDIECAFSIQKFQSVKVESSGTKLGFTLSYGEVFQACIFYLHFGSCFIAGEKCASHEFLCRQSNYCIPRNKVCDFGPDCFDMTDELKEICQPFLGRYRFNIFLTYISQ